MVLEMLFVLVIFFFLKLCVLPIFYSCFRTLRFIVLISIYFLKTFQNGCFPLHKLNTSTTWLLRLTQCCQTNISSVNYLYVCEKTIWVCGFTQISAALNTNSSCPHFVFPLCKLDHVAFNQRFKAAHLFTLLLLVSVQHLLERNYRDT